MASDTAKELMAIPVESVRLESDSIRESLVSIALGTGENLSYSKIISGKVVVENPLPSTEEVDPETSGTLGTVRIVIPVSPAAITEWTAVEQTLYDGNNKSETVTGVVVDVAALQISELRLSCSETEGVTRTYFFGANEIEDSYARVESAGKMVVREGIHEIVKREKETPSDSLLVVKDDAWDVFVDGLLVQDAGDADRTVKTTTSKTAETGVVCVVRNELVDETPERGVAIAVVRHGAMRVTRKPILAGETGLFLTRSCAVAGIVVVEVIAPVGTEVDLTGIVSFESRTVKATAGELQEKEKTYNGTAVVYSSRYYYDNAVLGRINLPSFGVQEIDGKYVSMESATIVSDTRKYYRQVNWYDGNITINCNLANKSMSTTNRDEMRGGDDKRLAFDSWYALDAVNQSFPPYTLTVLFWNEANNKYGRSYYFPDSVSEGQWVNYITVEMSRSKRDFDGGWIYDGKGDSVNTMTSLESTPSAPRWNPFWVGGTETTGIVPFWISHRFGGSLHNPEQTNPVEISYRDVITIRYKVVSFP